MLCHQKPRQPSTNSTSKNCHRYNVPQFSVNKQIRKRINVPGIAEWLLTYITLCWQMHRRSLYAQVDPARNRNKHILIQLFSDNDLVCTIFVFAGPRAWNNLRQETRLATTMASFKSRLKTELFDLSYV